MSIKQFALSALSCLIVILFFNIPIHKQWLQDRILYVTYEWDAFSDNKGIEGRKKMRWGSPYQDALNLKKYLVSAKVKDPLVLIPPDTYVNVKAPRSSFPEPIVYYYYSGIRTVRPGGKDVRKANVAIFIENNAMQVKLIDQPAQLDSILTLYTQF